MLLNNTSFWPPDTRSIQPHCPCRGDCPGSFFQHPVTSTRHSRCFVVRYLFAICNFLPDPRWCRCARTWKSSRFFSTPKIKDLMTLTPRIAVMTHVFSSIFHAKTTKCLEDYSRSKTSFTFSFNYCHKIDHRNS
jgi:hypothetical protein